MSDDFLSRWSRRKDEARTADKAAVDPAPQIAGDRNEAAAEPALTPEDIASLPRLEELTCETDITGFLRPGVPSALRKAALRKMWLLDPAIRDFPGHARDYAYDWNTPGGVPGNELIPSGEEIAAMARRILGTPDTARSAGDPDAGPQHRTESVHRDGDKPAASHQEETASDETEPASRG